MSGREEWIEGLLLILCAEQIHSNHCVCLLIMILEVSEDPKRQKDTEARTQESEIHKEHCHSAHLRHSADGTAVKNKANNSRGG